MLQGTSENSKLFSYISIFRGTTLTRNLSQNHPQMVQRLSKARQKAEKAAKAVVYATNASPRSGGEKGQNCLENGLRGTPWRLAVVVAAFYFMVWPYFYKAIGHTDDAILG